MENILLVNSCIKGREESRTYELATFFINKYVHGRKDVNIKEIAVNELNIKPFTKEMIAERDDEVKEKKTDKLIKLAKEFAQYDTIVVRDEALKAPRQYGLTQNHKHLKEMNAITGLKTKPVFCPIVADYYSGMEVTVPIFKEDLLNGHTAEDIKELYKNKYNGKLITYKDVDEENGFMTANALSGYDNMFVSVKGNDDRILLTARYDNLGKGASGAAVECLNYILGREFTYGLDIQE